MISLFGGEGACPSVVLQGCSTKRAFQIQPIDNPHPIIQMTHAGSGLYKAHGKRTLTYSGRVGIALQLVLERGLLAT